MLPPRVGLSRCADRLAGTAARGARKQGQQRVNGASSGASARRVHSSFDAAGFLSGLVTKSGSATLDSHSYTRDAVGNVTQEVIGGLSAFTSSFGYDDLYRPTSATDPTGVYSWSYL